MQTTRGHGLGANLARDNKIRGKSSQPKVINPKVEANKIAHHLATRADHQTLPEEVKLALEKQPDRLQSIYLAKIEHTDTDTPFTPHQLETVLSTQKKLRSWRRQTYIHLLLQISPLFQR